jgi:cytochrome P450
MFGAGSETTSSSLLFAFLYMIKHPDIQAKIQAEIDQVCAENSVTLDDRPSMPYTDAVLHEVMRYACLVYAGT